jgi:hypothetical protein
VPDWEEAGKGAMVKAARTAKEAMVDKVLFITFSGVS